MNEIVPPTGYYYPNRMGRIFLTAMRDAIGQDGLRDLLAESGADPLIRNFPPDNLEQQFDFAYFSNINQGLGAIYGPRGSRRLALRGGREMFKHGLSKFGDLAGVGNLAFKVLPLETKLRIGIPTLARIFTQFSDQDSHVVEKDDHFLYYIDRCSVCWQREADHPICFIAIGILQEALRWVSGEEEFRIDEIECVAMGAEACVFKIDKEPIK